MAWMTSIHKLVLGETEVAPKTTFECSPEEAKQLDALGAARPATEDEVRKARGETEAPKAAAPQPEAAKPAPKGDAK